MCNELQIICQIYCKKTERKAFLPLPAQLQEAVLVQNVPFCLPLQPSVPPCRERLTFSALSLLQGCSHRRNSAGKAISCKNSGETRTKPSPVLSPTPQACCFLPKWRRLGTMLQKSSFPKENLLSPFQSVQCPSVPVIPHFPTVRGCTAPPACWNWKNTAQGKCSHVCIALNNQDQAVSGITRAMGSSQL